MKRSAYDVELRDAAAGTYHAMLEAALLSAAGLRTAGRRGYRATTQRATQLRTTYGPRTADAYRALRGQPQRTTGRTAVIATATMIVGAGAALTAVRVRHLIVTRREPAADAATADLDPAGDPIFEPDAAADDGPVAEVLETVPPDDRSPAADESGRKRRRLPSMHSSVEGGGHG